MRGHRGVLFADCVRICIAYTDIIIIIIYLTENHKTHIAHYIYTHKYSMELLGTYRFICKH